MGDCDWEPQSVEEPLAEGVEDADLHVVALADSHMDTEEDTLPLGDADGERVGERVCVTVTVEEEE